tara:strand:- start:1167 stop:1637 length:471 start_codon:yes stop_codon:yes gene_type:complete
MEYNSNSNSNTEIMSDDLKNILMYYQSVLRNIGVFSTLSITLFTFSFFFHRKNKLIATCLHIISFIMLIIVFFIAHFLSYDINIILKKNIDFYTQNKIIIDKWMNIIKIIYYFLIALLIVFFILILNDLARDGYITLFLQKFNLHIKKSVKKSVKN